MIRIKTLDKFNMMINVGGYDKNNSEKRDKRDIFDEISPVLAGNHHILK
jgi:hypothetical protein